ncbi:SIS domain-containing protein [Hyalangium versicolor]|uniref:SIS domain-containing protein n=1 Tax=Hyalangium versicolor TaxID=2861190 RepID=UPI001CCE1BCF|nr:SIS domain-containing protein [Hyalangium versicolor]
MNVGTVPSPAMAHEAMQAAEAARMQIRDVGGSFAELGERLRRRPPRFVVTCARGSSDHAAHYGKYLIETTLGCAVASMGPSVASVYNTQGLNLKDSLFIAISQSGRSPDLLRLTEQARKGGALVVGFINSVQSPLYELCDIGMPLCAGPEKSVAATKSYLASGLSFLQLVAHWSGDEGLRDAVSRLPEALDAARELDWWPALAPLAEAHNLFVLGRGVGLGAALEMALKFKETSRLHAEAFSTAEVLHGPLALVGPGFPILALGQEDSSAESTRHVVRQLVELGANVRSVLPVPGSEPLPTVPHVPSAIAPLCQVQSFYMAVHRLAAARKLNPDAPAHLRKVTETV